MLKTSKGVSLDIKNAKEIAAGGEGRILEHPTDKKKVIKIYHQPRKNEYSKHLQLLSNLGKHFVEPQEIYFNSKQECAGFDMSYVNFSNYWLFNNLFNKGFCNSNGIDKAFKYKILMQLKECIEELHKKDIVVGDLNQYNLFFGKKGDILFVDTDSYKSPYEPHSGVLLDDIRDWTTMDINKQTDSWAFDILVFWSTTFCHPFKWVAPNNTDSLEQRVKKNMSFLRAIPGIKIPALYEPPAADVKSQFEEIFSGRRYMVNLSGQHVHVNVQIKQPVTSNSLEIRELFDKVTFVFCSGNKISVRTDNRWLLVETVIPKVTRILGTYSDCDVLLPSNTSFAKLKDGVLISEKGNRTTFRQPEFYYNSGSLMVLDYDTDMQYNFDLEMQLAGISNNSLIVFAKSFIIRDVPIQNFGAQKYMNIPVGRSYTMIGLPPDTKNAVYCDNHWAIEYKKKTKVGYMLMSSYGSEELDYLPYFTVKSGMLFVPENGYIDVYKDLQVIMKLDCPQCTRDSKLYSSVSGILLLENNTLYLLNTK
jgi:hypothetical protein